jgi:hypothetical protein
VSDRHSLLEVSHEGAFDAFYDEDVNSIFDAKEIDRAKLDDEFDRALGNELNSQRPRIDDGVEKVEKAEVAEKTEEAESDQYDVDASEAARKEPDLEAMLAEALLARESKTESEFVRRFPREQHRSASLRQMHDLPRRIKARSTPIHDSPRNRQGY